jgi:hypothetical protein
VHAWHHVSQHSDQEYVEWLVLKRVKNQWRVTSKSGYQFTDLTRRCSRRLAGLFPPVHMIKILPEIASRALIRMLPMLTRSGFPSMSHCFPLAPFTSRG